jgi:hypothetical protein
MILGLALLAAASQAVRGEGAQGRRQVLHDAAEGGLEYGYWAFTFGTGEGAPTLPIDLATSLGGCAVSVHVADNTLEVPDTIRVTSTASREGKVVSLTRVYLRTKLSDVFNYALACDGDQRDGVAIVCGTDPEGNGDVYVNGDVDWPDAGSAVYGAVFAQKAINDSLFAWDKYPGQPSIEFPALDLAYYQAAASVIYTSNTTLANPTFDDPFTLVYVDGNLTIQGTVTGTGTIVANGDITIEGDLVYAHPGQDKIALLANDNIEVAREVQIVYGILYAATKKVRLQQPAGELNIPAGVLASHDLDMRRPLHVVRDPDLTDELKEALQLPGYVP